MNQNSPFESIVIKLLSRRFCLDTNAHYRAMLKYPAVWVAVVHICLAFGVGGKLLDRAFQGRSVAEIYPCSDGRGTFHPAQLCDGIIDCIDGSDENNFTLCETKPRTCTREEFTCANRRCVPFARLCNKEDDCLDRSDEMGCNPTGSCEDGACAQGCTPGIGHGAAYLCHCAQGFRVGSDHRSCEDIDECASFSVHHCPQLCENTIGSFSCRCQQGFIWSQYRCLAIGSPPVLVYAMGTRLLELIKDKFHYFVHSDVIIRALDIDPVEKAVYWVDKDDLLKRSLVPQISEKSPTSGKEQVLTSTGLRVVGIAVDWVARNLYWAHETKPQPEEESAEDRHGYIAVSTLGGRYWKILVDDNVHRPHAIVVIPEIGQMVWSDMGCSPRVESSWMDGTHRRVLVHTDIVSPTGLTVDYRMNYRVFWSDSLLNKIESVNLDGTDRVVIAEGAFLGHPMHLDVFGLTLYWTTRDTNKVRRQDKFGRGTPVTVTTHATSIRDFRIYQSLKHDLTVPNACANRSCSHLCLLIPKGAVCACPEGTSFQRFTRKVCDAASERKPPLLERCSCRHGEVCKVDAITHKLYCI